MKLEFSRQISEKSSDVKSHFKKSVQWNMGCSMQIDGTNTDKHDEVNGRLTRFCEYV